MSLLSVAQGEAAFNVASNLDTAATEFVRVTGSTASNQEFGTLTQSSDSLTGSASYIFGSNARVQYSGLGTNGGFGNFIQEFVFKKSTKPAAGTVATLSSIPVSSGSGNSKVYIDEYGNILSDVRTGSSTRQQYTTGVDFCDNRWHHVIVSYIDGSDGYRVYVDGTLYGHGTTYGNTSWYAVWNIGSLLATDLTTASAYFDGKIDFAAFYTGASYSTTGMDSFVANHLATFANKVLAAPALAASALAVQPSITTTKSVNYAAAPATASATFPAAIQSARDSFTLLDTYMQTLALEQYYKFDEPKVIANYGTGGSAGYLYSGTAKNDLNSGIQGEGALRITGTTNTSIVSAISDANIYPEITDGDFSLGFWVKKSTAEGAIIFSTNDEADQSFNVEFLSSGYIRVNAHLQNQDHTITASTNYANGNWHYVAVRMSGSTMQLWIDNVSKGTVSVTHSFADMLHGDFGSGSGSVTELMYVSQFYIASSANVTSTQIANIWTYGQPTIQGGASMPMPRFSRDNALNQYIAAKSPILYFKMDEATGLPLNSGSVSTTSSTVGSNYTQNISSPNYKAYSFSDKDTHITGSWTAPSQTFSNYNRQTVLFYTKFGSGTQQAIGGAASNGDAGGQGLIFQVLATGALRLRNYDLNGFDSVATSATFADGNYHMVIGVKDNANMKIYVDGIERASMSAAAINLTDDGQFAIAGLPTVTPAPGSRTLFIDEFAVFNTAFSAQDAFEAYQKIALVQDTTANALMVQPSISTGYGPNIHPAVMYASGLLPEPFELDTINILPTPLTATGLFQNPNYAATKNFAFTASAMLASSEEEPPFVTGGGVVGAEHFSASAIMPSAYALLPGHYNASPMIATGNAVQPALVTTKGALIKPQSLNASAFFALPPAYYLVSDDRWYQRLLLVDYQSNNFNGITTFFNTSSDIVRGGGYGGWEAKDQRNAFNSYYGYNLTDSPLPVAYAGSYDTQNRKAIRLRNIALVASDGFANADTNWTFETYVKTTKKNQILFVGKKLGDRSNSQYQDFNAAWRLRDGKISLNEEKSLRLGSPNSVDAAAFTGFKDIADGQWHHIIIQYRPTGDDQVFPRTQVFIDGELDIQRYGYRSYAIHQIGYNSLDANAYSDFETSAVSINQGSFVLERETHLNYYAAVGIVPVEATVATASATLTPGNKGRGNRGRALMLYFWPTFKLDEPYYRPFQRFQNGQVGLGFTNFDQGTYGSNPDTFYAIPTQLGNSANQFYDWDIWPVPVTTYPAGDTFVGDSHPVLKDGIFGGTDKGLSYLNPITANERYLNLQEDLKDLSQFDMICFRNYPDDSNERDIYGTGSMGVADPYFNVLDKTLFEDFLKSLRDAVDSGISLLVTNPQLAVDMGFIDTYHTVDALDNVGSENGDFVAAKINDPLNTGSPVLNINYLTSYTSPGRSNNYEDYYRNNYHQVVSTIPGLTDDPAYIWKDEVYYKTDGLEYGELERVWSHIEYNSGLQPGDKFLISSMINAYGYYAVPIESIKAGKVITKFADTYMHGKVERINPYRNYATTIAIEPGTVVAGKQIGAKVFISFTDNVGNQQSLTPSYLNPGSNTPIETRIVELNTDYWIDYAYSTGNITDVQRDKYKADPKNIDRLYPNGGPVANALKYWSLNGQDILGQANAFDGTVIGTDTAESVKNGKKTAKTRAGMRRKNTVSTSSLPAYTIQASWIFPTLSVSVPNINTRGLWWLSERLDYEELPQRPLALEGDAFMPNPLVSGYKVASVNAQAMVANAKLNEVAVNNISAKSPNITNTTLPLTAEARLVGLGLNVMAPAATASAKITTTYVYTTDLDQVTLYIMHEDPILYLREDVIK